MTSTMTDENVISLAARNAEAPDTEEDEDEEYASAADEFRELYQEADNIRSKLLRLARAKAEEGNSTEANILRVIAGDVLPLLSDLIATSGGAFDELQEARDPDADAGLPVDEAVQIYVTISSNLEFLKQVQDTSNDANLREGLQSLIGMNESSLEILREHYGDEIHEAGKNVVGEAKEG